MKHDKLVRDHIPEIIAKNGDVARTHTADTDEYRKRLGVKLQEEVDEFLESPSLEELADIAEVLNSQAALLGFSVESLEEARKKKKELRGGFDKRIVLEETE